MVNQERGAVSKHAFMVSLMVDIYVVIDPTVDTQTTLKLLISSGLQLFSLNLLFNCFINQNINAKYVLYVTIHWVRERVLSKPTFMST